MNKITEKNTGIKKVMESIKGMSKKKKAIFCTVATGAVCVGVFVGMELLKPKNVADNKVSVVSKEKKEDKKTSEKDKKEEEKKSSKSETKKEETKTDKDKTSTKEKSDNVKKSDSNSSEKTVSETPKADTVNSQQNSNKGSSKPSEPVAPPVDEVVVGPGISDEEWNDPNQYFHKVGPNEAWKVESPITYATFDEAWEAMEYEALNNPAYAEYSNGGTVAGDESVGFRWYLC